MNEFLNSILDYKNWLLTLVVFAVLYLATKNLFKKQESGKTDNSFIRQVILFLIVLVGIISLILALPLDHDTRGQITNLIGIVISAILALSSATFFGNSLAGVMFRIINNFKVGDFVRIDNHFGRITERGLFHTEIQNVNRNLVTFPNLYMAKHATTTVRSSGTLISSTVSLGYDTHHKIIEKELLKAVEIAELKEGFVQITELGDFSISFKVFGLLENVKSYFTAQSKLNTAILDCLHNANIEIVSPTFMNQRQINGQQFIAKENLRSKLAKEEIKPSNPESVMFDKADKAENIERKKSSLAQAIDDIKELKEKLKNEKDDSEKEKIETRINRLETIKEYLEDLTQRGLDE